jgi:hypothetical protein
MLCTGSTLPLAKQSLNEVPYKLSGAIAKLAGITFWSLAFSWTDKPWFLTKGKLTAVLIKPSSWGSELDGDLHYYTPPQQRFFWRRCRGKRRLLQGEFRTHILYFVLSSALLYFYLHHFIKNTQKISILYSCFYLSAFSFARMATPENTKLCDFTITNNSDFICTPIAPPAPKRIMPERQ